MVAAPPTAPESLQATAGTGAGRDVTAVTGRRVVAFLIDVVVVLAVVVAVGSRLIEYNDVPEDFPQPGQLADACDQLEAQGEDFASCAVLNDRFYLLDDGDVAPLALTLVLTPILLLVVVQGMSGLTAGKLVTGIRVVAADGSTPGMGRAAKRFVALAFDGLFTLGIVGLFTAGTSDGHRRLGDRFAGTFVVGAADTNRSIRSDGRVADAPVDAPTSPAAPLIGADTWVSAPGDADTDDLAGDQGEDQAGEEAWSDAEDWSGADDLPDDTSAEPAEPVETTDETADEPPSDEAPDETTDTGWTTDDPETTDEPPTEEAPADSADVWEVPEGEDWAEGVPIDAPVADIDDYATDDRDDADDFPWAADDADEELLEPDDRVGAEVVDAAADETDVAVTEPVAGADQTDEPADDGADRADEADGRVDEWAATSDRDDWSAASDDPDDEPADVDSSDVDDDADQVDDEDQVSDEDAIEDADSDTDDEVAEPMADTDDEDADTETDDEVAETDAAVDEPDGEEHQPSGTAGGSSANPPPQWDAARRTYIQWDARRRRWLEWDEPAQRWKPIDT